MPSGRVGACDESCLVAVCADENLPGGLHVGADSGQVLSGATSFPPGGICRVAYMWGLIFTKYFSPGQPPPGFATRRTFLAGWALKFRIQKCFFGKL